MAGDLEATIFRTDYGTLLLPIWYDREAQFVPGQMAANDAGIVVPFRDDSASAWEISTTAIRKLTYTRPPGGKRIVLKKFDQTAAVVITSDRNLIAQLRRKMETLAEPSAKFSIELAKAKLERVTKVDAELQSLGAGQPDAPQILTRSQQLIEFAEQSLRRKDYDGARQMATDAMQLQRILQRAHWEDAIRKLSSPVSSPHTICFQTLPDHWRMIARLGESRMDNNNNLLRSGDFEDIDTMTVERWQHTQKPIDGVRAAAELYPQAKQGNYSLRLLSVPLPGKEIPAVLPQNPVTVTTPPVMVRSGQIVTVSGWVRVMTPISHSLDGGSSTTIWAARSLRCVGKPPAIGNASRCSAKSGKVVRSRSRCLWAAWGKSNSTTSKSPPTTRAPLRPPLPRPSPTPETPSPAHSNCCNNSPASPRGPREIEV